MEDLLARISLHEYRGRHCLPPRCITRNILLLLKMTPLSSLIASPPAQCAWIATHYHVHSVWPVRRDTANIFCPSFPILGNWNSAFTISFPPTSSALSKERYRLPIQYENYLWNRLNFQWSDRSGLFSLLNMAWLHLCQHKRFWNNFLSLTDIFIFVIFSFHSNIPPHSSDCLLIPQWPESRGFAFTVLPEWLQWRCLVVAVVKRWWLRPWGVQQ